MSRDKQIEEIENDLRYFHTEFVGDDSDIYTDYRKTAEKLAIIGYRRASDVAEEIFAEIDDFQSTLRHIFLGMCGGDDYNTLNLLQIDGAIEALFDSKIAEIKKKYSGKDTNVTTKESEEGE